MSEPLAVDIYPGCGIHKVAKQRAACAVDAGAEWNARMIYYGAILDALIAQGKVVLNSRSSAEIAEPGGSPGFHPLG